MPKEAKPSQKKSKEHEKLQFDYAWSWFNYHAGQRMTMFNYLLAVTGLFATAIVSAYDKHLPNVFSGILCLAAAFFALAFLLLDYRNRKLVWLGEDILIHLEKNYIYDRGGIEGRDIFGVHKGDKNQHEKTFVFGILSREKAEDKSSGLTKHRVLLPLIAFVIMGIYVIAAVWFFCQASR